MTYKTKIATAVTTSALLLSAFAPAAFANGNQTCTISGNGVSSYNRCRINVQVTKTIEQINGADVSNSVGVVTNTGRNHANSNTGSSVSVVSGGSTATVTIANIVNSNSVNSPSL